MADIDIVPKHGSRTWLWIVLALVVIALLWAFLGGRDRPSGASIGHNGPTPPRDARHLVILT